MFCEMWLPMYGCHEGCGCHGEFVCRAGYCFHGVLGCHEGIVVEGIVDYEQLADPEIDGLAAGILCPLISLPESWIRY